MKQNFLIAAGLLALTACAGKPTTSGEGYAGHGAESVSPELLKKFAAPALPRELNAQVQALLDVRSPALGMQTPNKRFFFFNWNGTGTNQIWRLDSPKGFPMQMTGGANNSRLVGITTDSKHIIVMRDRDGDEYYGLFLQPVEGGPLKEIFRKEKAQAVLQLISDDGKSLYFRANDVDPKSFYIHRYDLGTGKIETVLKEEGYWVISDERPGKILAMKVVTNTASEIFELDLASKKLTPVIGQGENQEHEVRYGTKAGQYLVLTPKLGDFRRLYSFEKGKLTPITPDIKSDVANFAMDRAGRHLVYEVNEQGYTRLKAMDARSLRAISLPAFPGAEHVYAGQMARDGSSMILGVIKANEPRASYSLDWRTGKLTQWVVPSQPEIDTRGFVAAKLEYYPASDGTPIPMFVRRPKHCEDKSLAKPCPVVVHFHGGPEAQSQPGFSLTAQGFVDNGFIFAEPNVRGSDGYGKKWLDADNGAKRLEVITDIEDAAKFMRSQWKINGIEPKIGVMGGSYGGYSTLYAMTRFAGSYDAGVAIVGMSNLLTFLNNTAPYRRALRTPEYGDPEKDKDALIKLSPSTYLANVKSPLLIIQGVADPRVPAGEAIQIYDALQARDVKAELILFADEGHGASKRENRVLETGHMFKFFKDHLQ